MSAAAPKTIPPVGEHDHTRGADHPKLTIIEYGDFGCPYCFAAQRPVESLMQRYEGVRLVWRHFPDPEIHPNADLAAELSELAAVHGSFWEAFSLLLAGRESFSMDGLLAVAERLGLERSDTEAALEDHVYRDRVLEDIAGGRSAGVEGTPTFFLNGERLVGHWRQLAVLVPEIVGAGDRP
ncbi:MAG TPA: DsbA family protein [Solirubrobacterales bacterium]|jgi:protein-disulfide isomerase|nr:DsbA family protein [Solirubrobacterales bacterium]